MAETLFNHEDAARLERTQSVRMMIVDSLTEGGKLPEDRSDRSFLLEALNGLDRTTLSRAKLKVESDANQHAAVTAQIVGELLTRMHHKPTRVIDSISDRETPSLPSDIVVENPIEGETMVGVETLSYETFINQTI